MMHRTTRVRADGPTHPKVHHNFENIFPEARVIIYRGWLHIVHPSAVTLA